MHKYFPVFIFCILMGSMCFAQGGDPFPEDAPKATTPSQPKVPTHNVGQGNSPFPDDTPSDGAQGQTPAPTIVQDMSAVKKSKEGEPSSQTQPEPQMGQTQQPPQEGEQSPEKQAEIAELLKLPVYKLNIKGSAQPKYQIGDEIEVTIDGLDVADNEVQARVLEGSSSLLDLGWMIRSKIVNGKMELVVSPLQPGRRTIPQMVLSKSDGTSFARTDILEMQVESALNPQDQEDKPIELFPPQKIAFPWINVSMIILLILGVIVLIVYGLVRWSRGRRPKPAFEKKPEPLIPEDSWALQQFEKIQAKNYASKNFPKPHYFGISETLKHYFARRFDVDAQEATTEEMIRLLESVKVQTAMVREIRDLYQKLDLVKFTDTQPAIPDYKIVLEKARQIVQTLKRKPEIPEHAPPGERPKELSNAV